MTFPLIAKLMLALGAGALLFGVGAKEAGARTLAPPSTGTKEMPAWLKFQYLQAKAAAITNPQALGPVAYLLRRNGFPNEADELVALAQTRAVADSPHTSDADKATAAAVTATAQAQAQSALPETRSAGIAQVTPGTQAGPPTVVQTTQGVPYIMTQMQTLAKRVSEHLNGLVKAQGGVARSKGKEDKSLIKSFQLQASLKADGLYGPKSAATLGQYYGDVPIVFYWPRNSQPNTAVPDYRDKLGALADDADSKGTPYDTMRAKMLRLSAIRERGQGFGTGADVAPSDSQMTSDEAADLEQQVAAAFFNKGA